MTGVQTCALPICRIMSSVDMEEIKTRAIEDLGMQYAEQGQVVEVPGVAGDYVRQYKTMP